MLTWNGEEVTGTITDIILRDNAGGEADTLAVMFPDPEQAYLAWQPKKGDVLEASFGGWRSGKMFFDGYVSVDRAFAACAISTPATGKAEAHRHWDNALFSQIAGDLAAACGLSLMLYDVENYRYEAVTQSGTAQLGFLQWLCEREGWQLKVHDGKAVVFNEKGWENKTPQVTINRSDMDSDYRFGSSSAALKHVCTVSWRAAQGYMQYTAAAEGIDGGTLRPDIIAASAAEAQRFAQAALRRANRDEYGGYFSIPLTDTIAAGGTVTLLGMGAMNGAWYLTRVEHRLLTRRTACRCRRAIEGDY
jgi:uncharacterized protein